MPIFDIFSVWAKLLFSAVVCSTWSGYQEDSGEFAWARLKIGLVTTYFDSFTFGAIWRCCRRVWILGTRVASVLFFLRPFRSSRIKKDEYAAILAWRQWKTFFMCVCVCVRVYYNHTARQMKVVRVVTTGKTMYAMCAWLCVCVRACVRACMIVYGSVSVCVCERERERVFIKIILQERWRQ